MPGRGNTPAARPARARREIPLPGGVHATAFRTAVPSRAPVGTGPHPRRAGGASGKKLIPGLRPDHPLVDHADLGAAAAAAARSHAAQGVGNGRAVGTAFAADRLGARRHDPKHVGEDDGETARAGPGK